MDFAYPPIPAGEKIITSETNTLIYPVFEDDDKIKQWNFAVISDAQVDLDSVIQLSDGNINFASKMSKISDSKTMKEKFVIFDDKQIYIIENVKGKNQLTKKLRTDRFVNKNAFFSISPLINTEIPSVTTKLIGDLDSPVINPEIQSRSFYCGYLKDDNQDIVLYDFLDDNFSVKLPFISSHNGTLEISFLSRITSYKNTYIIFITTEINSNNQYGVSLYAITERDLAQKSKNLTVSDFIINSFDLNDNYPVNIFIDHFYYDEKNTGSTQFILCFSNTSGDTTSLDMFEINEDSKIVKTYSCSSHYQTTLVGLTPVKQRQSLCQYLMTEHGPVFFLNNTILEINEACSFFPIEWGKPGHSKTQTNGSSIFIELIIFDSKDKKFIKKSNTKAFAHHRLSGEACDDEISISKVYFKDEMPLINYVSMMPKISIVEDESKGLLILVKSITLFCSIVGVKLKSLNTLSDICTTADPSNAKVLFLSVPIGITDDANGIEFTPLTEIDRLYLRNILSFSINVAHTNITVPLNRPLSEITNISRGMFFQVGADLVGNSIILGVPNLSFGSKITQINGFYRALPYQEELKRSAPIISVSSSKSTVNGIVESVSSNWQDGYHASGTATYEGAALSANFGKNFGGHNMTMNSDTKGISLHSIEDLSSYDLITGYGADFYLWEYPAYRHTTNAKPFDFITILVPIGYSQQSLDAKENDLGYFQDYEIGGILTYIGSKLLGYSENDLLFTPSTITVTSDTQGGMSLTYDKNSSTSKEKNTSTEVSMNAGVGLNLFGIISLGGNYTKSTAHNKSTHTVRTLDYSLTFHSGTINDSQYEYKITPLVYKHKDSGVIITTCRIELEGLGSGWKQYFSGYDVRLMRSFPGTKNKELRAFSRSIRFEEQPDNTVNISLYIFNNSLYPSGNIKCDIYLGKANFNVSPVDVSKLKLLSSMPVESMDVVERKTVTLEKQKLKKESFVSIIITVDDLAETARCFWGAYPYNYTNSKINSILNGEK